MATSTVNLGALLRLEGELRRQLEGSFSISGEKNNVSNQKKSANGYDKQHKDDEENNRGILEEFEGQYVLEQESGPKKHTKKKLVKKKKTHSELEAPPLPVSQVKKLTTVSEQMPTSSFSRPNKQQLREAILWAEVLGEPKCKKRHRR